MFYHSPSHLFLLIPSSLLISSTHSLTDWFQYQSQYAILYSNYIYWYEYIACTATVRSYPFSCRGRNREGNTQYTVCTVLATIISYSPILTHTHTHTRTHTHVHTHTHSYSAPPTQSAPLVTIVIAVCGSVVSTVVVMVAIFLFVCCCKHKKNTKDTTYRVNTPTGE